MASYDIAGNIIIVKFKRGTKANEKKKFARDFLATHKGVTTVVEKSDRFKGRLRTLKTRYLAGEKTLEAIYKENGCMFRFNLESCYFSPRLASERAEIASMVKKGESVLVLFGGVAPFAIVIAKNAKAKKVVSLELGRECVKYARENVVRNKVKVELIQGDARRKLPLMKEQFDRIVMARPNLEDSFLDVAFPRIRKGGIIYYYGFYHEDELQELKDLIMNESIKARRKIKIIKIKKAGDIGTRKYRYRVDIKVLN